MNFEKFNEKFNKLPFEPVYIFMLISLILRLVTFMGISEGDDLSYTLLANRFANGDFAANFIFDIRWVVYVPVALLYKIFGVNDFTSLLPTMLYGIAGVWLAYKVVLEETDRLTASLATLLYLSFPIILIYGNFLQVAPSLEFFTLLTVYSFQRGIKSEKIGWFVLGGFAIGGIFFARTTGLFIAPLASFYVWYRKGFNRKTVLWIACAALCSLVPPIIQGFVYLNVHNDFFHHITISRKGVDYMDRMFDVDPKDLFFYIRTMFTHGNFANWMMFGLNGYFIAASTLACIVLVCMKKAGKETLFFIWFISYFLFMTFAPTSLSPYTTLIRNTRYAIIFLLPVCAIYGIFLNKMLREGNKALQITAVVIFLTIFISNIAFSVYDSQRFKDRRTEQKSSVEALLKEYPDALFYIPDKNTARRIAYYSGYTNNNYKHIRSLNQIKKPGIFLILKNLPASVSRFYIPKEELLKIRKNPPKGMTLKKKLPFFYVYEVDTKILNKEKQ
ncbi:glycosyltransferase family 39 protein [bacterium]|nr:glycosyltransferase family 39 protein [bacterium]